VPATLRWVDGGHAIARADTRKRAFAPLRGPSLCPPFCNGPR
jgi:hypothetical protein